MHIKNLRLFITFALIILQILADVIPLTCFIISCIKYVNRIYLIDASCYTYYILSFISNALWNAIPNI